MNFFIFMRERLTYLLFYAVMPDLFIILMSIEMFKNVWKTNKLFYKKDFWAFKKIWSWNSWFAVCSLSLFLNIFSNFSNKRIYPKLEFEKIFSQKFIKTNKNSQKCIAFLMFQYSFAIITFEHNVWIVFAAYRVI